MSDPSARPRSGRDPAATRQRWIDRLQRFRSAGLTVAAFCAAEGVSVPTFYQWKRQLARTDPPRLIPVRITSAVPTVPVVEVVLLSGTRVRLPPETRPEILVAILRGVEDPPC